MFNIKFYIQHVYYGLMTFWLAVLYEAFYDFGGNRRAINENWWTIMAFVWRGGLALLLAVLFIFLSGGINDQIQYESTIGDQKNKRFLEKKDPEEIFAEYMGEEFSINWFFPIKQGGCKEIMDGIIKDK